MNNDAESMEVMRYFKLFQDHLRRERPGYDLVINEHQRRISVLGDGGHIVQIPMTVAAVHNHYIASRLSADMQAYFAFARQTLDFSDVVTPQSTGRFTVRYRNRPQPPVPVV